jgi:hypothetical protein
MAAIYKVSYVVSGEAHPGAILNTGRRPKKGDLVTLGTRPYQVVEVIDLIPPRGEFRYLHATVKPAESKGTS